MRANVRAGRAGLALFTAAALLAALAVTAGAAAIVFQTESLGAFNKQLAAGQVHAVTFNKKPHTIHISLNNHQHMLASYDSKNFDALEKQIQDAGVPVLIEHPHANTAPVHHRLRYVAAGVLIVLIVVIGVVLWLNKRRPPEADAGDASAPAAGAAPPAP